MSGGVAAVSPPLKPLFKKAGHSRKYLPEPLHSNCFSLWLLLTTFHPSLRFTTFHYVSLRFTTFHYVSLRFTTFHYFSLLLTTSHYFSRVLPERNGKEEVVCARRGGVG